MALSYVSLIPISIKSQNVDNMIINKPKTESHRKTSSISRTKSQNINVSCILLQLCPLNPLKPGVELRMKM